jgi:hypothetical protein
MVNIITGALRSVGDDQAAVVEEVCHSNATAIAQTVAELEQMHRRVEEVKITLLEANAGMQAAGNALVGNVQHVSQLEEVQANLQQAAAAVQAAQAVLEQCLIAGELIKQQQLYPALCMLDKIRRKHLGELMLKDRVCARHCTVLAAVYAHMLCCPVYLDCFTAGAPTLVLRALCTVLALRRLDADMPTCLHTDSMCLCPNVACRLPAQHALRQQARARQGQQQQQYSSSRPSARQQQQPAHDRAGPGAPAAAAGFLPQPG